MNIFVTAAPIDLTPNGGLEFVSVWLAIPSMGLNAYPTKAMEKTELLTASLELTLTLNRRNVLLAPLDV